MKKKPLMFVLLIIFLSACNEQVTEESIDQPSELINAEAEKTELDYELDALRLLPFLTVHDDTIAAAWLSLQDNHQPNFQPTTANIAQYEARLQFLAKQLKEDKRIIANRTVQTRDLLAQNQIHESLNGILDGMTAVAKAGVEGDYGSYCQWYINLRQSQFSHQESIEKMKRLK